MRINIDEVRKSKGISITFLVDKLNVSRSTYYAWVRDGKEPGFFKMIEASKVLNCKLEDLYEK